MHFLITGHTGFKGAWLSLILQQRGHLVSGISLEPEVGSLFEQAGIENFLQNDIRCDIRESVKLSSHFKQINPDVVIHLAAQALVRESYKTPIETYETNVIGTLNFLKGIKDSDVSAAVVITTDKVYKNRSLLRGYTESDEIGGHDPYSSSKAAADIATQSWVASFECKNVAIARAGNVVGGGDWAQDRLIPDLVRAFAHGEPAKVRYPNSIRPWQHVADCLSGYLALSDAMLEKNVAGEWNFGPQIDINTKVSRVADLALSAWGGDATWEWDQDAQLHEAGYLLLDSTKARKQLNWQDKLDFPSTINWAVSFYQEVIKGSNPRDLLDNQISKFLAL